MCVFFSVGVELILLDFVMDTCSGAGTFGRASVCIITGENKLSAEELQAPLFFKAI